VVSLDNYLAKNKLIKLKLEPFQKFDDFNYTNTMTYYQYLCDWESSFNLISFNELTLILPNYSKKYYDYIDEYRYFTFCVDYSFDRTFRVNRKTVGSHSILLTKSIIIHLKYLIIQRIIEGLYFDFGDKNVYQKKRIYGKLVNDIDYMIDNGILKNENNNCKEEIDIFTQRILKLINKVLYTTEDFLISLGICLPILDYSSNQKLEKIEDLVSLNEESPEEYNRVVRGEVNRLKMFTKCPTKLCVFKESNLFQHDVTKEFNLKPGILKGKKFIIFDGTNTIFRTDTENLANPRKYSKTTHNYSIIKYLVEDGILIDTSLFKLMEPYFLEKIKDFKYKNERLRYISLFEEFKKISENKEVIKLYLPYFFDFRGRIYPDGMFNHYNIKLLRHTLSCNFSYDYIGENLFLKNKYSQKILEYKYILNEKINLKDDSDEYISIVLLGLLNLGKLVKSKLMEIEKGEYSVELKTFLEVGLSMYLSDSKDIMKKYGIVKQEDIAIFLLTKEKLINYILYNKPFNVVVDSTASGYFHLST
jgi:hypothetical protein